MDAAKINWQDQSNSLFYNTRLSNKEIKDIEEAANHLQRHFELDSCILLPSSGSSGKKKLYAIKKNAILSSAKASLQFHSLQNVERSLCVLPHHHIGAIAIYARAYLAKQEVLKLEKWNVRDFMELARKAQATSLVPTQVYDLLAAKETCPKNLKHILVGGAHLNIKLYQEACQLGWPLYPSYGATEASSQIASAHKIYEKDYHLQLLPHIRAKCDEKQRLWIQSPSLFHSYYDLEEKQPHRIHLDSYGFFQMEDHAIIEGDHLIPLGRSDDYIKIKGEALSLMLIEKEIAKHLDGTDWAVLARPHPRDGNELILATESAIAKDLLQDYQQACFPLHRIQHVYQVKKLARNDMQKVSRLKTLADISANNYIDHWES